MGKISLKGVHKVFDKIHVIKGVDLEIEDGEFIVFIGPSGCGKSTMLRLIAGLEEVSGGKIEIDDVDVTALDASERGLSMVFQSYALYPHMSNRENIGFGLKMSGMKKANIEKIVADVADTLQLNELLDRKPKELSGGQRQRVAIGRSIVRNPKAFLFDEPLSNLDASLRVQMRIEIARLHKKLKKTMVYVTHDQVEAMTLADRIIIFNEGYIQQEGSPLSIYLNPSNLFTATFIGSPKMNILECSHTDKHDEIILKNGIKLTIKADNFTDEKALFYGIRPEHITISNSEEGNISGTIGVIEHLGSETFLYVDIEKLGTITVKVSGTYKCKFGDIINLSPREDSGYLFDKNKQAILSRIY